MPTCAFTKWLTWTFEDSWTSLLSVFPSFTLWRKLNYCTQISGPSYTLGVDFTFLSRGLWDWHACALANELWAEWQCPSSIPPEEALRLLHALLGAAIFFHSENASLNHWPKEHGKHTKQTWTQAKASSQGQQIIAYLPMNKKNKCLLSSTTESKWLFSVTVEIVTDVSSCSTNSQVSMRRPSLGEPPLQHWIVSNL